MIGLSRSKIDLDRVIEPSYEFHQFDLQERILILS